MTEQNLIDVAELLKDEITEPILYAANDGNAGDALMACATYDLFDKLGIAYTNLDLGAYSDSVAVDDQIVILAGGGNFNALGYNTYAHLLERIHNRAKKIIVLPHTINRNDLLLSKLRENVTLICREKISFEHVSKAAPKARVLLAHDMAFMLDIASIMSFKPRYFSSALRKFGARLLCNDKLTSYPALQAYRHGLLQSLSQSLSFGNTRQRNQREAYLYRVDIESTDFPLPLGNLDASLLFNYGVTSPMKARFTVHHLLKFLHRFNVIHTNRLHIAIASALLDKTVNLHANNYYKCRAVYEHSIKYRFPKVIWHD